MKVEPLGDSAFIMRELPVPAYLLASSLNECRIPGLLEAVAAYETVGLYTNPESFDPSSIATIVADLTLREPPLERRFTIPVCYSLGPDLGSTAEQLGISADQLVSIHSRDEYRCYAIGFCPGFPYLGYLDERISGVPRLPQPRTRVEPGMVGITGRQTGIYPLARPGGWRLIGQTPLQLVDVEQNYFPLTAGDLVRFEPIGEAAFGRLKGDRL
jgi:inhibitor of KinA